MKRNMFAKHSLYEKAELAEGWDGEVSSPPIDQESSRLASSQLRTSATAENAISNLPLKTKKFLLTNPSITEEVIINY